jgi:hypothetical protein
VLDRHTCWTSRVNQVCKKLTSHIFAIKRLAPTCSLEALKSLHFATLHSHISNGIEIYGGISNNNLNEILVRYYRKKAIQSMLNWKETESCKEHFKQ